MGGSGKSTSSSQQVTIPPDVLSRYNAVNAQAQTAANTPFQTYSGQFVAPVTATQQAGVAGTNAAAGQAQPYFGAATSALGAGTSAASGLYGAAGSDLTSAYAGAQPYQQAATALGAASAMPVNAQQIGPQQINQFLSPYLQTVLGSTANVLNQNNQQQQAGQLGNAIENGSFGGDRSGIAAANLEEQQNLANANIYSGIANQGFTTALGAAQQQQGVNLGAAQANRTALGNASETLAGIGEQGYTQGMGLGTAQEGLGQTVFNTGQSAANTLAGLGTGAQSASLQGAQAQLAAGQVQQQTQQAQDTAEYNQFLQQQSYPFQTAQFLANIAEGTGALSGSTTTTTQPGGFFSDERLKEDIEPVGKTFDGQDIVRFKYKGDPHTRIGLIAQDVEKEHPEALGLAHGFKTVEYGKATDDAAARGHFAYGGITTIPGIQPMDMASILQAQANSFGPYAGSGLYGGSSGATPHTGSPSPSSYVPAGTLPVSHLAVAGGLGMAQPSPMQQMNQISNAAKAVQSWIPKGQSSGIQPGSPSDPTIEPLETDTADTFANDNALGGAIKAKKRAAGGGSGGFPYSDQVDSLDIPDEQSQAPQLAVAHGGTGSSGTGLGQIGQLAGGLGSAASGIASILPFLALKRGGRAGFADGGSPFDDLLTGLDSAAGLPGGSQIGPAGLGTVGPVSNLYDGPVGGGPGLFPQGADPVINANPVTEAQLQGALGMGAHTPNPTPMHHALGAVGAGTIPDQTMPTAGAGVAATNMMNTLEPGPMTSDTMSASPGPLAQPPNPEGLGAAGAGLPSRVTPDTSQGGSGGGLGDVLSGVANDAKSVGNWFHPPGGFLDRLAQGKTDAVLPFLSGIAAMGTAPTRHLGVALAAGLGAGTQTYLNTQQQQANIAKTQAESGLVGNQAARVKTATMDELAQMTRSGLVRKNPDGTFVGVDGTHYVVTGGGGAGTAAPPTYNVLGKAGQDAATGAWNSYAPLTSGASANSGAITDSNNLRAQVYAEGQNSTSRIPQLDRWASSLASTMGTPNEPGALASIRQDATNYWNTAVKMLYPNDSDKQNSMLINGVDDAQIATKLSTGSAAGLEKELGQRSFAGLQALLRGTPNMEMQAPAALRLIADGRADNQENIDKMNYLNEFDKANQANGAPATASYLTQNAIAAFNRDHPQSQYENEREALYKIVSNPKYGTIDAGLRDPVKGRANAKALDQAVGLPGFHGYFTGNRGYE